MHHTAAESATRAPCDAATQGIADVVANPSTSCAEIVEDAGVVIARRWSLLALALAILIRFYWACR